MIHGDDSYDVNNVSAAPMCVVNLNILDQDNFSYL